MQELSLKLPDNQTVIAVALSGGADSMALLHMLAQRDIQIHALTVDHALRADSADEAARIGAWVADWPGVKHTVLRWDGDKPVNGRMAAARDARYALMADACAQTGIRYLAVAHHADDQAETFFMRLTRGSGLDGLASMREMQAFDDRLTLWRPLLNAFSHDDLVAYCRARDIPWVEDPTNVSPAFTRNRLRMVLKDEGLSDKRLGMTLRRLERASDTLRDLAQKLLERARTDMQDDAWTFDLDLLRGEPFELSLRVIRTSIDTLGATGTHGARLERVEEVAARILSADAPGALTLGGCVLRVTRQRQTLVIARENAS